MRRSFMYDLFFGNLVPWERGRPQDPAYTRLTQKTGEIINYFQKLLSPKDYEKLEEMGNLQAQSGTIEDIDLFDYAFCMGILMMIEVFGFKETRLKESE